VETPSHTLAGAEPLDSHLCCGHDHPAAGEASKPINDTTKAWEQDPHGVMELAQQVPTWQRTPASSCFSTPGTGLFFRQLLGWVGFGLVVVGFFCGFCFFFFKGREKAPGAAEAGLTQGARNLKKSKYIPKSNAKHKLAAHTYPPSGCARLGNFRISWLWRRGGEHKNPH